MATTDTDPPPFWQNFTRAQAAGVDLDQALRDGLIPPRAFAAILAACTRCPDPLACDDRHAQAGPPDADMANCENAGLIGELRALATDGAQPRG
jgi:hypothetical protein